MAQNTKPADHNSPTSRLVLFMNQLVRYTGVGAIGTLVHYLTLISLVQAFGVDPVAASVHGFIAGGLVNYFLNYRITFKSDVPHRQALLRFFAIAFVGLIINSGIMTVAANSLHLHYLIGQVIATAVVLVWTFLGNRVWTFGGARHGT